ncbi:MAG: alpha/beta hydrolase protein [Amycolatopsis sp.]|uniref:alpha/beta hydrolase n=1 Tax=Amycolatopsis sp. TaxID=37632 RepID=UPI0026301286|nr:alpha/beta hydrolase [Amycolatopsis sp.]MCU1684061.1 alpha/beta hydrolase protein [Amycolatopsis sp.]
MSYVLDPELVPAMAARAEQVAAGPVRERGDWKALREAGNVGQAYMATLVPQVAGIKTATYHATARDGSSIELRWYTTGDASQPGPAVVYAHGGGMVLGSLDTYDALLSWYVARSGVPILSVGYRLAPEATGTALAEDVFAGLAWLAANAAGVGVDPARIAVMGDSGGGAPTAGATILARDRGLPVARQLLVYPMLDDRNQTPDPALVPFATWGYGDNYTAWQAVLGADLGCATVAPVAAPGRLKDFSRLPPAYLEVGDLDIFRDETIAYAQGLARAGVPVELHVHPGAPHGWDRFAADSASARRAYGDRVRVLTTL